VERAERGPRAQLSAGISTPDSRPGRASRDRTQHARPREHPFARLGPDDQIDIPLRTRISSDSGLCATGSDASFAADPIGVGEHGQLARRERLTPPARIRCRRDRHRPSSRESASPTRSSESITCNSTLPSAMWRSRACRCYARIYASGDAPPDRCGRVGRWVAPGSRPALRPRNTDGNGACRVGHEPVVLRRRTRILAVRRTIVRSSSPASVSSRPLVLLSYQR